MIVFTVERLRKFINKKFRFFNKVGGSCYDIKSIFAC